MTFMKSKISSQSFLVTMTVRLGKLQKERERKKHLFVLYKKGKGGFIYRSPILPQGCTTRVSSSSLLLGLGFCSLPFPYLSFSFFFFEGFKASSFLLNIIEVSRFQGLCVLLLVFYFLLEGFRVRIHSTMASLASRWKKILVALIIEGRLQWHEGYSESRQHSRWKQLNSAPTRLVFTGLFQTLYLIHN